MNIFKTSEFARWQKKSRISDESLINAILEMDKGLVDANLGGNVYKKRIAKAGFGKSGSYRTIVATKKQGIWIFLFGFEKNKQASICRQDLDALQEFAAELLTLKIDVLKNSKEIVEVKHETKVQK
jgi:hypothetical protein